MLQKVLESIHQENFNKRKQLDRIRYTKKKKMEKFRLAQVRTYTADNCFHRHKELIYVWNRSDAPRRLMHHLN